MYSYIPILLFAPFFAEQESSIINRIENTHGSMNHSSIHFCNMSEQINLYTKIDSVIIYYLHLVIINFF